MALEFKKWSKWEKIESDYWQTTYRDLNPFMPPIICHECDEKPTHERWSWAEDAPVSRHEFKCKSGHVWGTEKTHD